MAYNDEGRRRESDDRRGKEDGRSLRDGSGKKPYRPKDDEKKPFKPRDGEKRPYKPKDGEKKPFKPRDGQKRSYGPKDGEKRPYRPRKDDDRKGYRKDSDRPRERTGSRQAPEPKERKKLLLPKDPSKLLYKGIDCQINGNTDLAMIMFLHGSVMMSEGCEKNADRILDGIGKDGFADMKSRISPDCSADALTEFDFICIRRDPAYDRSAFDASVSEGGVHALYRKICLEEVEDGDPIIDEFASMYADNREKVKKGLDFLRRRKGSDTAKAHLARIDEEAKLVQSMNSYFVRAMNGDVRAAEELERYSGEIYEAGFFYGFLKARAMGEEVEWLKSRYDKDEDLIVSKQAEFKIQDDPFGKFLKAESLAAKKEEWIPAMMVAAKAGSQEAIDALIPLLYRNDVRRCLAEIYTEKGDIPNLLTVYQAGMEEPYYLDRCCNGDPAKVIEVGASLGKQSVNKEMDWLREHYQKGMEECGAALVERSHDEFYQNKKMLYTLHDIGMDMEAARLYFEMEGNPELPSVKWLSKVCSDEEVKDFVRSHYEAKDDIATFDSIFEDDGYERRPKRRQSGPPRGRGRRQL